MPSGFESYMQLKILSLFYLKVETRITQQDCCELYKGSVPIFSPICTKIKDDVFHQVTHTKTACHLKHVSKLSNGMACQKPKV